MTRDGGCPFSTHCSSGAIMSNVFGPSPPPQWPMPGTMKSRSELVAFSAPSAAEAAVKKFTLAIGAMLWSAQP